MLPRAGPGFEFLSGSGGERLPLLDAAALADPTLLEQQMKRLEAGQLPWAFAFSSNPGDAVLFNHCLMHSAFHKPEGRAFVGIKFAEQPKNQLQFDMYSQYYKIDAEALATAEHPRLRELAARERALRGRWQGAAKL